MFLVGLFEREEGTNHKYGCISYPSGSKIPQLIIFFGGLGPGALDI